MVNFYIKVGVLIVNKVFGYEEFEEIFEDEVFLNFFERRKLFIMGVVELDFFLVVVIDCNEVFLFLEVLGGVEVKWVGISNFGDYLV